MNYHRQPIINYLAKKKLTISDAKNLYIDETLGKTIELSNWLQTSQGLVLYVLEGATLPDKGFEAWTESSRRVAQNFVVTAKATTSIDVASDGSPLAGIYPTVPQATAAAIVYNANDQRPHDKRIDLHTKRIFPIRQPRVGWDTLQWKANPNAAKTSPEPGDNNGMPFELIGKGLLLRPEFPEIELAWEAKLVPLAPASWPDSEQSRDQSFDIVTH